MNVGKVKGFKFLKVFIGQATIELLAVTKQYNLTLCLVSTLIDFILYKLSTLRIYKKGNTMYNIKMTTITKLSR